MRLPLQNTARPLTLPVGTAYQVLKSKSWGITPGREAMKQSHSALVRPAIAGILLALAGSAQAQFFIPSIGPTMRPLGGPLVTTATGGFMPFYVVGPSGFSAGYLGPNG